MVPNPFRHDLSTLDPAARAALDRKPAFYIDGAWQIAAKSLPVFDPSSGDEIGEIADAGASEVDAAVRAAKRALHGEWAKVGPQSRERMLRSLAELVTERAAVIGQVETADNGMPTWLAQANMAGAAGVYDYYAGWPTKITGDTVAIEGPPGETYAGFIQRAPIGVVAAIVPWNVPFKMAAWKLAPALAAGCTVVLKPAEDTSFTALMLADLVAEAGFPAGVFNIVTGLGRTAGEALIAHPDVNLVSFTGSTATGRHIGEVAGRGLKRAALELGGKSPVLLFNDANLDEAVPGAAGAIFLNSGQVCVAGSRLYVQSGVYDEVIERLHRHTSGLKVGAGLTPDVFMGPLVNSAQKKRVRGYIDGAVAAGCEVLRGPEVDESGGHYVSPAIVTGAESHHAITREEVFGPVLSVYRFDDEEEALIRANESEYGLAAIIWSRDVGRVMRVANRLECGKVSINSNGFPYPALPEGGNKASGTGRNLGPQGLEACLVTKTVLLKL